ncbi:DMT family transporter [Haloarcula argentinensis]|uniref:DMT family transporter n=1 Tax=Haloarcula argentinensis TaxID=43776 RepID=A0A830FJZ5_HALAR|nr:DMT family transporter [Haloarcula argentinensis]EMA23788.1 DMT(drug/metabolite transporter) superfamily permease [Haloarcula argentinensis DSM 12282]MDS0252610.1 DMT family transporter [Haloarcula argentinensis]GGM30978.1 integral membrane protein [Haloarcula argentinensis]
MISRRTFALAAVASVLLGGTFVGAKAGLSYLPPLLFVSLRFDIAAVVLLGYVVVTRSRDELLPRTRGDVLGILSTGLFALGLANALIFVGQQSATSAVAAIIFSLNPILTPVFAALLLSDERLSARGGLGMVIGLLGVGLVVSPDPAMLLSGGIGKLILFAGATSAALGSVLIRWSGGGLSSTVRTAWALPVAAALCHSLSIGMGESAATAVWSPTAIAALLYVGIFAGAIAYIAYFGLLDVTGAIQANLIFYVVPVVSTLGGWALLGEAITPTAVAGFLIIFTGFVVLGSESVDIRALLPGTTDEADTVSESLGMADEPRGFESD